MIRQLNRATAPVISVLIVVLAVNACSPRNLDGAEVTTASQPSQSTSPLPTSTTTTPVTQENPTQVSEDVTPNPTEKHQLALSQAAKWPVSEVRGFAWSQQSDSFVVAVTDNDGTGLRLYDTESSQRVWLTQEVYSFGAAFVEDGVAVASAVYPFVSGIQFWEAKSGQTISQLSSPDCSAGELIEYNSESKSLLAGTYIPSRGDNPDISYIYKWDLAEDRCVGRLTLKGDQLLSIIDGYGVDALILSLSVRPKKPSEQTHYRVETYNIQKDAKLCEFPNQTLPRMYREGELLTLETETWSSLNTWDLNTCALLKTTRGQETPYGQALAVTPDGLYALIGRNTIQIWSLADGRLMAGSGRLAGDYVDKLYISPDGKFLISIVGDQTGGGASEMILWRIVYQ